MAKNGLAQLISTSLVFIALTGCVAKKDHELALGRIAAEEDKVQGLKNTILQREKELALTKKELSDERLRNEKLSVVNQRLLNKSKSAIDVEIDLQKRLYDAETRERARKREQAYLDHWRKEALERLKDPIAAGQLDVLTQDGYLLFRLPSQVLFSPGSAELREEGLKPIRAMISEIQGFPHSRIDVIGHTDSQKIEGKLKRVFPSNWELSATRAAGVVRAFAVSGFKGSHLSAIGRGPHDPLTDNKTPANRALNRRIEVRVFPPPAKSLPKEKPPLNHSPLPTTE